VTARVSTHVYCGTSFDGFIARPDGDIGWLVRFADDDAVATLADVKVHPLIWQSTRGTTTGT